MKSLVTIATNLALIADASANLPWILFQVRKAQIHLIIESQASKWPKASVPKGTVIKWGLASIDQHLILIFH